MDLLLGKVTQQAVNFAIRSGVSITATYALQQSRRLVRSSPKSNVLDEYIAWQMKFQRKVQIVSPAIDMIELIAARGNTSLESAVALTKDLRYEIQIIGQKMAKLAAANEQLNLKGQRTSSSTQAKADAEMLLLVNEIQKLLERIEDAVPLINLAITTSGARLSTQLPSTVSPSRLLQASTLLTAGDNQYATMPNKAVQIGPTFILTLYMLFAGHDKPASEEDIRDTTWKEVIHKARVKMRRVPMDVVSNTGSGSDAIPSVEIRSSESESQAEKESRIPADAKFHEFAYQIMIIEDLDDDRVHDFDDEEAQPGPFDDVKLAGIREMIPIHEISKIFYADTSKVLNISPESEAHHPVLLLKRDVNAVPPRRMMAESNPLLDDNQDENNSNQRDNEQEYVERDHADRNEDPWRLPPSLDPEWIAFEVYQEQDSSDTESEGDGEPSTSTSTTTLANSMSALDINSAQALPKSLSQATLETSAPPPWVNQVRTSLSLLELLLRLTSLQQFQQQSHLSITDELLTFFLEESASTGAGGDEHHRQAVRAEARRRVGWDPYDESPLKRRGEEYQQYGGRPYQEFFDAESRTPTGSPSPGPGGRYVENRQSPWSSASGNQTGSVNGETPYRGSPGLDPSTPGTKGRTTYIRQQSEGPERKGSPLRQSTGGRHVKDEGLGTSPASSGAGK